MCIYVHVYAYCIRMSTRTFQIEYLAIVHHSLLIPRPSSLINIKHVLFQVISGHYGLYDGYWGLGSAYHPYEGNLVAQSADQYPSCTAEHENVTLRLYELFSDPSERCNLAHAEPERLADMLRRLTAYEAIYRPPQENSLGAQEWSRYPASLPKV